MRVIGRATAQHRIREPSQLKYIHAVTPRDKNKADIRRLEIEWSQAIKRGEVERFRVYLEEDFKAALYVYDWGKRKRVCSVSLMYVPDILIQLHKGA